MTKARDLASAAPAPSTVSATELGYLDGVTSAVQTQVDAKIAKTLTTTTGDTIYASSANTPARLGIGTTGQVLTVASGLPTWATPASGLTLISRTIWSAAAAVNVNNCFTSTYSNYRILIYSYANNTYDYFMRLRAGGTDNTSGNYSYQQIDAGNTTVTAVRGSAQTSFKIGEIHTTYSGYAMDVYAPQESTQTNFANMGITGSSTGTTLCNRVGGFYDTTSFDGFSLYPPSGNFTGTVTVYGYQKS